MYHNSPTLGTQMSLIYYIAPLFQRTQSQFMSNIVKQIHSIAYEAANRWCYSFVADKGVHWTLPCSHQHRACWNLRPGQTQASRFLHLLSGQIHPFIYFTSNIKDYIWVTVGLLSLQYYVYAFCYRGASENITVYNDLHHENQNQNNNELI